MKVDKLSLRQLSLVKPLAIIFLAVVMNSCACDKSGADVEANASVADQEVLLASASVEEESQDHGEVKKNEAGGYGAVISTDGAVSVESMLETMGEKTEMDAKVQGEITACCQKAGCWMKMSYGEGEEMRVVFRDYGFFVPKDIPGSEVVIEGTAVLKEVSVETLRHFAEDGGASEEEIAAITEPSFEVEFTADGVMPLDSE
jgi:hypothetical protein